MKSLKDTFLNNRCSFNESQVVLSACFDLFFLGPTLPQRNLKTQQSSVIVDLCLRNTRSGQSHDYRDCIVPEKQRFQNVFRPQKNEKSAFSNSTGMKSVLKLKAPFSWSISVDGTPNFKNEATFSNFKFGVSSES